jgi:hypothetical protein
VWFGTIFFNPSETQLPQCYLTVDVKVKHVSEVEMMDVPSLLKWIKEREKVK